MRDKELLLISTICILIGSILLMSSYGEYKEVGRLFGYGIWVCLIGVLAMVTWILRAIRPPRSWLEPIPGHNNLLLPQKPKDPLVIAGRFQKDDATCSQASLLGLLFY